MPENALPQTRKQRQSNFELFRIIAMLMIIAHHFILHGDAPAGTSTINNQLATFILPGGKIGVNCFILVSGYFLVNSKFSTKRLIKLFFEVLTYSIGIFLVFCIINPSEYLNPLGVFNAIIPFQTSWYFNVFLILMLLTPLLNLLIKHLSKSSYKKFLIVFFVLFTLVSTIPKLGDFSLDQGIWFIYMYFVGAYIRKYGIHFLERKRNALICFVLCYVVNYLCQTLSTKFLETHPDIDGSKAIISSGSLNFISDYTVFVCIASIALFMLFKNINIGCKPVINFFSASTFSVYLIHDNPYIRKVLWSDIVNTESLYSSSAFPLYILISVFAIFLICTLIDFVRRNTIDRWIFKLKCWDKLCKKFDNWYAIKET